MKYTDIINRQFNSLELYDRWYEAREARAMGFDVKAPAKPEQMEVILDKAVALLQSCQYEDDAVEIANTYDVYTDGVLLDLLMLAGKAINDRMPVEEFGEKVMVLMVEWFEKIAQEEIENE